MNKEQAIKEINKAFEPSFANYIITALTDGATVSDKVSEQEPCEDCISREAVLMEIDKYMCGVPFDKKGIDVVLKELPHVTPTRKKGKWIGDKNYPICEKCGCDIYEEYIGRSDYAWIEKPMCFCPNCGAEMESEE